MKTLVPVSLCLFVAACNCGDARLIHTFEPGDAGSDRPDASIDVPDASTEVPDAGVGDAGVEDPDAGINCSPGGWCREALLPDGNPITTNHLRAVFARTQNEAWAVGDHGTILIYDGTGWHKPPPGGLVPADDLFAVWASAANDVWVAGIIGDPAQQQGMFAHFNGVTFDAFYKPLATRPEALFGWGKNDVWSVGYDGAIFHFTGGVTWLAQPLVTGESLTDISGVGGKLFAAGANGTLLSNTGNGWTLMPGPTPPPPIIGGLGAIVAFAPNRLFAAGGNDWLEFDGVQWTHRNWPLSLNVEVLGLWGATPQRLWGVGPSGKAWKFEGATGTLSDTGVTELLRDVHGVDEQHVWAVGFNGTVLRRYRP